MLTAIKNALSRTKRKLLAPPRDTVIERVLPWTMVSRGKLRTLRDCARAVAERGVDGDFVECGTCRGGSAALLAANSPSGAHLWLYDSFQGLPEPVQADGPIATEFIGKCLASQTDVEEALMTVNFPTERRTIRAGWFEDTLKQPLPESIALLHLDCDFYEPVLLCLQVLYPRLENGGCVILDDFGVWEGCREAFYDWCAQTGEKPLLWRTEKDQAYWFKGQTHARDESGLNSPPRGVHE